MLGKRKISNFVIAAVSCILFSAWTVVGDDVEGQTNPKNLTLAASVYEWNQGATGDWQLPANWTPARTAPAFDDVLIFDTGGTTTAANIPTQLIGQLIISGNTTVNFQTSEAIALNISGGAGNDLRVDSGSALNFNSDNAITANLGSGASGTIRGSIKFSSSGAAAHRLTAIDAASINFGDGAVFTAGTGFTGNAFGTTNLNTVIFDLGSKYVCMAGSDPFGAAEPASVVVFKTGSLFSLQGDIVPSFSGRTYGNFEMNYAPGYIFVYGTSAWVVDDLTILAGTLALSLTGTPGHSIRGDIKVMQGCSLEFQAPFPGVTINLNGKAHQTLTVLGGIARIPGNTLAIDNPSGVTVTNLFAAWNLELINGVVSVTNDFGLFGVSGNVSRVNGYIIGNLRRTIDSTGTYKFDVGTENGYSPVTVEVTAGHDFIATVKVKAIQAVESHISDPSRALLRYWQITGDSNITGANLIFDYLDPQDIPVSATESGFVVQKYSNSFTQPAGIIDTQSNTFRVNGLTDLSAADWTLAEPGAVASPTATATPVAGNVSGTVTYGNAIGAPQPRVVSNALLSGTGSVAVSGFSSFPNGTYSLSGFGSGAYSVTPSKTGGINGITSFDAGRVAQHVAGINPLTGNQAVVADVSGNGTLSSFDAGQIARYVAGLSGFGSTGNWRFTPANRTYASVTGNIAGEDFTALLMGEVSGNWANTGAR